MALDNIDVLKTARLARLAIDEADAPRYATELSKILTFVEQMNAVDTENVSPLTHPFDATQRLREDRVTCTDERELFLSNAPAAEAGLFLVPKVIDEE